MESYGIAILTCLWIKLYCASGYEYPVPKVKLPPGGQIWPWPSKVNFTTQTVQLTAATIEFDRTPFNDCPSILNSVHEFTTSLPKEPHPQSNDHHLHFTPTIKLTISINQPCQKVPQDGMQEYYHLKVTEREIYIHAEENWGVVHAFSTLKQMLWTPDSATCSSDDACRDTGVILLNVTEISDRPRLAFRGVLLDTSRHYLPIETIKRQLEIMGLNKLNVFHWHIVDDPSFPYVSEALPKLTNPFSDRHVYTVGDVKDLIAYAADRAIRVIPEFDTPGHTKSWANVDDGFSSNCPNGKYNAYSRPVDPTREKNYQIIETLFHELRSVFADEFLHLGGDEVQFTCWKGMQSITDFMQEHNFTTYKEVEAYYIKRVVEIATRQKFKSVVWEEVFFNDPELNKDALVHIWKGGKWRETADLVNEKGYRYLLSGPWYLNYISYGEDWRNFYSVKLPDHSTMAGAELCMWGEFVDETNLEPRLWPRASAVAEKMWSAAHITEKVTETTRARLNAMRCFLVHQGYQAQPIFPGFC